MVTVTVTVTVLLNYFQTSYHSQGPTVTVTVTVRLFKYIKVLYALLVLAEGCVLVLPCVIVRTLRLQIAVLGIFVYQSRVSIPNN